MELSTYEQLFLLDCMLEMGELLLDCGAEISRVEDTLSRMGKAYGANRADVFVSPSPRPGASSPPAARIFTGWRRSTLSAAAAASSPSPCRSCAKIWTM